MPHVWFLAYLFLSAMVFALFEIQIEGRDGWAASLPTWKIENGLTRLVFGTRPLTGYHFYGHIFVLLMIHLPFALGLAGFELRTEMRILSFMTLFWILEDFLWFVLNPHFGFEGFSQDRIWWHRSDWWWIMPREYWVFAPAGAVLYVLSWSV